MTRSTVKKMFFLLLFFFLFSLAPSQGRDYTGYGRQIAREGESGMTRQWQNRYLDQRANSLAAILVVGLPILIIIAVIVLLRRPKNEHIGLRSDGFKTKREDQK